MAFRLLSLLVALVMAASGLAQETRIPLCHITSDGYPKVFETLYVAPEEFATYEDAGDLEGPCNEWLGELCSDGLKCTKDFDYDLEECLPEPREVVENCTEMT